MISPEDFIKRWEAFVQDIVERDAPLAIAAQDTHAKQVTRIFVEGKNSDGGKIGTYNDTTPLYANPLLTPGKGFRPQGKVSEFSAKKTGSGTGDTFKNGKARKTKYFPSYKSLKQVIGQESSFVNLEFSGDLKSDFSNNLNPLKINVHEYVAGVTDQDKLNPITKRKENNANKIEGNEKRFGAIFRPTKEEKANFFDIARKEYNLKLKKLANA